MIRKPDLFASWFVALLLVGPIIAGFVGLCLLIVAPFVQLVTR
jgi:hypothetical protein